ncbi:MAG: ISAzo13-like element transposase-related protein [Acidiferrobacterales bacterium]
MAVEDLIPSLCIVPIVGLHDGSSCGPFLGTGVFVTVQAGLVIGQIAVNVSAIEFRGKDFLAGVRATFNETGLDPQYLELELTESGVIHDTVPTMTALRALKELGVRIAIDDFGTQSHALSPRIVGRLLNEAHYRLQGNRKTQEGGTHPDRNTQFVHISTTVNEFQDRSQPVISVDA